MNALSEFLTGVFPLALGIGLLALIGQAIRSFDGPPPRPTRSDTATPLHPRRRRPFPTFRLATHNEKKSATPKE